MLTFFYTYKPRDGPKKYICYGQTHWHCKAHHITFHSLDSNKLIFHGLDVEVLGLLLFHGLGSVCQDLSATAIYVLASTNFATVLARCWPAYHFLA